MTRATRNIKNRHTRVAGCRYEKISGTKKRGEIGGKRDHAHMWRDVVVDIFLPYDDEQHSPREMGSMNLSRARIFARRAKEPSGSCDIAPTDLKNNHGSSGAVISNAFAMPKHPRSLCVHRKILLLIFRTRRACLIGFSTIESYLYVFTSMNFMRRWFT